MILQSIDPWKRAFLASEHNLVQSSDRVPGANLAGVFRSLRQALTGKCIPFQRTPKVSGRTTAPARVLLAEYGLLLYTSLGAVVDVLTGRWLHAFYSSVTAVAFLYAIVRLIGLKETREDLARSRRASWTAPAGEKDVETTLQSAVR